ncbi:MAG TPA: hypothetical protein VHE35_23610 [Kofleriaceae bacterium]|nr:hypothetical protein [Kofleriaceae bacterium]
MVALLTVSVTGCKFPYPGDVVEDATRTDGGNVDTGVDVDASAGRSIGGAVTGLWTGGLITLHLQAGAVMEDLTAGATEPFAFSQRVPDGTTYVVTVADDGPDHDCAVANGNGRVMGADVTDLSVTCTNLVPHSLAISSAVPFAFDPRVTHYPLPASLLQQDVSAMVTGPTLTAVAVAGTPATLAQWSAPAVISPGQSTIPVDIAKGAISRRYELAFDRGSQPIAEARYARASNPGNGDGFGIAVAASADYVAVGAWYEDSSSTAGTDEGTTDSGAVYLFHRDGQEWTFSQRLKGSAITRTRYFGYSLALDGSVLVVGAYGEDARGADAGAAYVFRLVGAQWAEEQRLTASDGRAGDEFGFSVAVSGNVIAVASPFRETSPGSGMASGTIYTFHRSGTSWIEESPSLRPQASGLHGWRLALDGDALAVGAMLHDPIYVYRRSQNTWLRENLPAVTGASIDLDHDVLAVGQPFTGTPGAVRIFTRTGGAWNETGLLQAMPATGGTLLGTHVSLHGDLVATSDTSSAAYLFHRVGGSWLPLQTVAVSSPASSTFTVPNVALTGNALVVGSNEDGGPGNALPGSGTAWIFR